MSIFIIIKHLLYSRISYTFHSLANNLIFSWLLVFLFLQMYALTFSKMYFVIKFLFLGLVFLFNGVSTIMGYLMAKSPNKRTVVELKEIRGFIPFQQHHKNSPVPCVGLWPWYIRPSSRHISQAITNKEKDLVDLF